MPKPIFKLIVAGSRTFAPTDSDAAEFLSKLDKQLSNKAKTHQIVIVSGTAAGADRFGEYYAKLRGYTVERYPADWATHGKSAGYKRNVRMAKVADALTTFWDGESRGTKHMIDIAQSHNLPTRTINFRSF
mgnify:CR=1 FL=1